MRDKKEDYFGLNEKKHNIKKGHSKSAIKGIRRKLDKGESTPGQGNSNVKVLR